jgi:hypothetical protein
MDERVTDQRGGILGLLSLIREHSEAVEYECIKVGVRLRDCPSPRFNWRDLWVVVTSAPRDSRLAREIDPHATEWTPEAHLLAMAVDALHGANWQRSGGKGRKPKRLPRPGEVSTAQAIGKSMPLDELKARLDAWHARSEADAKPANPKNLPPRLRGLVTK